MSWSSDVLRHKELRAKYQILSTDCQLKGMQHLKHKSQQLGASGWELLFAHHGP